MHCEVARLDGTLQRSTQVLRAPAVRLNVRDESEALRGNVAS